MSPPPVRVDTNASMRPSGEKSGRDSVASCATSNRASPPDAGTVQISPPDTKAISLPSGEMPGSANDNCGGADDCPETATHDPDAATNASTTPRRRTDPRMRKLYLKCSRPG